jgi:hypothetical protein
VQVQPLSSTSGLGVALSKVSIPTNVWDKTVQFLLDKKTGSIQLNVQNGRVLGVHLKEIVQSTTD